MSEGGARATAKELRRAVGLALQGDWEAAHEIAQEHEGDAIADWIHAVAHRMEGDLDNSRYWYRRCRREANDDLPVDAELRMIQAALAD
jgi:hypothetical protein